MKLNLTLYLFFQSKPDIKNINYPNCKNCIYFKEDTEREDKYTFSRCKFYGEKNNLSGEIEYKYASTCRDLNFLCGEHGKHYKENNDKQKQF